MKVTTSIKLPTYSCCLVFIITDNAEEDVKKLMKKLGLKPLDNYAFEGILISADIDRYYLVVNSQYLTYNTISHELYHAVVKITEERDVVDEEAQAWLSGHLSGVMYKFIDKKGLKVKHN